MGGQHGTKEVQEVVNLVAVAVLAVLKEVKKDGFQPKDLGAFLKSPEFEVVLAPALADIEKAPLELAELDLMDGFRLGRYVYAAVDKVLDELKLVVK